jgi:hypothetical protein
MRKGYSAECQTGARRRPGISRRRRLDRWPAPPRPFELDLFQMLAGKLAVKLPIPFNEQILDGRCTCHRLI